MKIFKDLKKTYNFTKDSILIIGNLDGVHKGHQSIISLANKLSKKKDAKVGVLLLILIPGDILKRIIKVFY